jgi:transposase
MLNGASWKAPHWHPTFLDFAGYDGFTPRLCRLYRARTKGKVERMIYYVRESFFVDRQLSTLPTSIARQPYGMQLSPTSGAMRRPGR